MPHYCQVALCVGPLFSYPISDNKEIRNARSFDQRQGMNRVMSSPLIRRADRSMSPERTLEALARGSSGGVATVCLFGQIRIGDDREVKQRFCESLMAKYGKPETKRPKGFFPRIDVITVYAIALERITGKEQALPPLSEQWPAKDRTKTPNASLRTDGL